MIHKIKKTLGNWLYRSRDNSSFEIEFDSKPKSYNLLRLFPVLSFVLVCVVSVSFAMILSHFMTREILQRDSLLTSQFITSIVVTQSQQARLGQNVVLGQVLDDRADFNRLGISPAVATAARNEFYDHMRFLPDVLHVNVYSADRKVIWSSDATLVGRFDTANEELGRAIETREMVSTDYLNQEHHNELEHKLEQSFAFNPQEFFVENYMPLLDTTGRVVAVVELYKEPQSLLDTIKRGHWVVWASTALGVGFLYIAMFLIIRRADKTVEQQQQLLLESESLCVIGEMSAAVAHGIRKPLTSIRTSAELAHELDPGSITGKYAIDIMSQTDRLDKWIRELLISSRPLEDTRQVLDMTALVEECIPYFQTQLERYKISFQFVHSPTPVPSVIGNRILITQALVSVVSNAIEAMPQGGKLELKLQYAYLDRRVEIVVLDTGLGLSKDQLGKIFKPFYTTKCNGIGLGMAQVKNIIKRSGAAIRISSQEKNGTCVTLSFMVKELP